MLELINSSPPVQTIVDSTTGQVDCVLLSQCSDKEVQHDVDDRAVDVEC